MSIGGNETHSVVEDPAARKRDLRLRRTSLLRFNDSTELVEVKLQEIFLRKEFCLILDSLALLNPCGCAKRNLTRRANPAAGCGECPRP